MLEIREWNPLPSVLHVLQECTMGLSKSLLVDLDHFVPHDE
jgi:hypothetical protein